MYSRATLISTGKKSELFRCRMYSSLYINKSTLHPRICRHPVNKRVQVAVKIPTHNTTFSFKFSKLQECLSDKISRVIGRRINIKNWDVFPIQQTLNYYISSTTVLNARFKFKGKCLIYHDTYPSAVWCVKREKSLTNPVPLKFKMFLILQMGFL